jgi:hypothetical protein
MEIKGVLHEDFVNYKKPSMLVMFPKCTFKCDKECGSQVCQNSALAQGPTTCIAAPYLVEKYLENPFTSAIVCAGLEPFDSFTDLLAFVHEVREKTKDDIVIYTGYDEKEIDMLVYQLVFYDNIYIKFGRYIPGQKSHYDEILGVNLASDNQYGKKVS